MISKLGRALPNFISGASIAGDGLQERLRSSTFALTGLAAAVGLVLVGLAYNQDWPDFVDSPLPQMGVQRVGGAIVVGEPGRQSARSEHPVAGPAVGGGAGAARGRSPASDATVDPHPATGPIAQAPAVTAPVAQGGGKDPAGQGGGKNPAGQGGGKDPAAEGGGEGQPAAPTPAAAAPTPASEPPPPATRPPVHPAPAPGTPPASEPPVSAPPPSSPPSAGSGNGKGNGNGKSKGGDRGKGPPAGVPGPPTSRPPAPPAEAAGPPPEAPQPAANGPGKGNAKGHDK